MPFMATRYVAIRNTSRALHAIAVVNAFGFQAYIARNVCPSCLLGAGALRAELVNDYFTVRKHSDQMAFDQMAYRHLGNRLTENDRIL